MRWPWKRQDSNARLVVSWSGHTLAYVHTRLRADGVHEVLKFGVERQGADSTEDFVRRLRALGLKGLEARVMLRPEQYQFLQIDAPAVPPEELRSATRYQIKDMLKAHAHVDDVTLDVMRVGDGQQQKGAGQLFVVAATNAVLREVLALGDAMHWNVAVIDIQETAQRNLQSALAGRDGRAGRANAALVLVDGHPTVLTISANEELFYTRRFELPEGFLVASWGHGSDAPGESADSIESFAPVGDYVPDYSVGGASYGHHYTDRRAALPSTVAGTAGDDDKVQRFLVEVRRSLDLWSGYWASMPLDEMRVYAGERSEELSTWFGVQLGQTVLPMDVSGLFPGFEGGAESDKALCLPLLGVLMRTESRKLRVQQALNSSYDPDAINQHAQQINLFTPIKLTQKRYFSAQTMLQTLTVFVLVGGGLSAYWVWSLNVASESFKKTLAAQARELESLQSAIKQGKADVARVDAALPHDLQGRRTELLQREKLAEEWQRGLLRPGWGHAARLLLVAQSIPAQVWVTEVKADEAQFEVSGFTLEPAALNEWVAKLAASPLLEGQKLSAVKLENASTATLKAVGGTPRSVWSFSLVSAMAKPSVAGGKP